jgi:ABC-type dipeptide/oligopeptide/nickel transport system permease subunit
MKLYYHDPREEIAEESGVLLTILAVIVGVFWGIVHFLDWMTVDIIPWWVEPLFIIPVIVVMIIVGVYGKNPLHWWPMFCGTRVEMPDDIWYHAVANSDWLFQKYGGALNVYVDRDYIKFRRKKDAVIFCLKNL